MSSKLLAAIFLLLPFAAPVSAQQADWDYEASLYFFGAETTTSIATPNQTLESTLSLSDALSNLDFAFMGRVAASNGRWSFILDYMLNDLSFGGPSPDPNFATLEASAKTQVLSGYAGYRVFSTPDTSLDLMAGVRWFDAELVLALQPAVPGSGLSFNDSWVTPLVGARIVHAFSDRWSGTAFFDIGGFSGDNTSGQVLLTADYHLNDNWVLSGGYRYITMEQELRGSMFEFTQSGPIFGATYLF